MALYDKFSITFTLTPLHPDGKMMSEAKVSQRLNHAIKAAFPEFTKTTGSVVGLKEKRIDNRLTQS